MYVCVTSHGIRLPMAVGARTNTYVCTEGKDVLLVSLRYYVRAEYLEPPPQT